MSLVARKMGNQWTTFFFNVMWLPLSGIPFLLILVCFGLCIEELSTCLFVGGRPISAAIWKMMPICIFFCVWKERNLRCFDDFESSMENSFVSSYPVSLDGGFFVPTID
jgi:hypothetical protein